ncbi:hypothetical protein HT031_000946 [Scenedesmus sp. PABB004]|nr:hypothetical protein HT031_000946 [Scenedesmus sp. PABB004]
MALFLDECVAPKFVSGGAISKVLSTGSRVLASSNAVQVPATRDTALLALMLQSQADEARADFSTTRRSRAQRRTLARQPPASPEAPLVFLQRAAAPVVTGLRDGRNALCRQQAPATPGGGSWHFSLALQTSML